MAGSSIKRQRINFHEFIRYGRLAAEMLEQGIVELPTKEAQYRALSSYKMVYFNL